MLLLTSVSRCVIKDQQMETLMSDDPLEGSYAQLVPVLEWKYYRYKVCFYRGNPDEGGVLLKELTVIETDGQIDNVCGAKCNSVGYREDEIWYTYDPIEEVKVHHYRTRDGFLTTDDCKWSDGSFCQYDVAY